MSDEGKAWLASLKTTGSEEHTVYPGSDTLSNETAPGWADEGSTFTRRVPCGGIWWTWRGVEPRVPQWFHSGFSVRSHLV